MRKFTKVALITALVFFILGSTLCIVGAVIGFRYSSIPEMIKEGVFTIGPHFGRWDDYDDGWADWNYETEKMFDFAAEGEEAVSNLNIDMNYGILQIEETKENQKISVEVKHRKENSGRRIKVEQEADTLNIVEDGIGKMHRRDNVCVIVKIPADMNFKNIDLQNSAGEITINYKINAENFKVEVGAGECVINQKLNISDKLYAQVDAGEIDFTWVDASQIELNSGVGEIHVEQAITDEAVLECGIGELDIALQGTEEEYDYIINCGVGEVEIAENSYSGLGTAREVRNGGDKHIDINCGVGEINVDFIR